MIVPPLFRWLSFVLCAVVCRLSVSAAVTVNAPQTITHRVDVQPIRVRKVSGATVPGMGTTSQEAYIKEQINRIWAQVGVRIDWLPFADYVNDFAYDGSAGIYNNNPRPENHLDTIVDDAPSPPKSSNPRVLKYRFAVIRVVPAIRRFRRLFR